MKKTLILFAFIATISIISSCSMYQAPCDGVGSITKTVENKI